MVLLLSHSQTYCRKSSIVRGHSSQICPLRIVNLLSLPLATQIAVMPELVWRFNSSIARQRLDDEHVHAAPLEEALRAQPLVQVAVEPHLHGSASATARDDARYLCHSSLRSMPSATCAI